ncbi:hypothetical protein [Variovorax sp. Root473]|jgi:hypothetical protein|uniref:hypothetical protein n=1 Tax=Variovorax sp. Root473 TaxID=1736541 RepID=UPI0006FF8B37|nr:hypothetical protein [Variovorax sp. Root473]KQX87953.1 hypothetical protein ASD34_17080 [Variovorax sp. Root473]
MSFEQIRLRFGRSFHRGDRVVCEGRLGTITGTTYPHVRVRFDGRQISVPCDPCEVHVGAAPKIAPSAPEPQNS